jgi:integrase
LHRRQLSLRIAGETLRVLGVRISAHQFRHLLGYLYLQKNPGGHEVVRRFLGHKRIETTIAFYCGMEQAAAVEHFDRFIEARRQEIAPSCQKTPKDKSNARPRPRKTRRPRPKE